MTKKEFIAELTSEFKQYDESNLIDFRSVDGWIRNGVKRFGTNVMIPTETVLRIENGRAKLPDNFWQLELAIKCDPEGYTVEQGEPENVITSFVYKTRLEQDYEWNNQITSYVEKSYKQITEKVYIDQNIVTFRYKNPTILRLTRGMKRDVCTNTCRNLQSTFTHSAQHEINILNEYVQTNFTKGYVYIQYKGVPQDENGDILIPETQHNHLKQYLMFHVKANIILNLMGNGDEPNLMNMYQIYSQKEREYFALAMTESKFEGLDPNWHVRLKNKMRLTTLKYEQLFP